jgi:hypothetical protein
VNKLYQVNENDILAYRYPFSDGEVLFKKEARQITDGHLDFCKQLL